MEVGNCLITVGVWLGVFMHVQWLVIGLSVRLKFLVGKIKSDVKVVSRLVSMVMLSLYNLKRATISFFILSMRGPGIGLCMAKPAYQSALKESGYTHPLTHDVPRTDTEQENGNRSELSSQSKTQAGLFIIP